MAWQVSGFDTFDFSNEIQLHNEHFDIDQKDMKKAFPCSKRWTMMDDDSSIANQIYLRVQVK